MLFDTFARDILVPRIESKLSRLSCSWLHYYILRGTKAQAGQSWQNPSADMVLTVHNISDFEVVIAQRTLQLHLTILCTNFDCDQA